MEGHGVEEVWSTERMRENRHNWSLSADTALLSYIQQFSQNLLNETHTTLKSLDSLESDLNTACVEANTVANNFLSLADTQFVENRVYDDEETSSPGDISASDFAKENVDGDREKVIAKHIKEALVNGLQVVSTKFEVVEIPDSDSEEDEHSARSGMVLKPINPYQDRVLPHLIGSVEFNHDDTLGLRESQSDEETEEAVSISDKAESETEDSEPESDQTKVQENNGPMDSFRSLQGVSFSEQLAARLGGVGRQENNLKSMDGNMFTAPVEEDDSDSLFFGDSRSSEEKSKNIFSDEQSPDLWTDNTDEDSKLFTEDKNVMVENVLQSSHMQDTLHSKYNSTSVPVPNIRNKRTEKPESLFDVTDEGSDLFHDIQQTETAKKKMPPGAVSIFGGAGVDLFGEKAVPFLSTSGSDKIPATKHKIESRSRVPVNKSEDHVDDIRSSVTVSKSSDSLKHGSVGLLQDEDEDDYDDLFSSAHINNVQKKSSKGVSQINVANKSRNTADTAESFVASTSSVLNGSDFLSSNTSLFTNEKTSLFDSSGDDLFSGDDIFSGSSSRKPFKLFDDDNLFDEKNKKSDLFDDLFVNNATTFHDNDIFSNEGLFKSKTSKSVTKADKPTDTLSSKVISSSGTGERVVKENTEDLFSYSEPSNSNSLQNSEDGLSRKYFGSEDSLTDNTNNISGVKSGTSFTQDLFKSTSSNVSENEGIFSQTSASTPQGLFTGSTENTSLANKETVSATHSIFNETNDSSDNDDIFSNLETHKKLISEHSATSGTLFVNRSSDSSSAIEKIDINHSNNADSSVSNKKTSSTRRLQNSPDLFGGEDDDLFKIGLSKKFNSKNEGSMPHQASKKSDNSSALSTKTGLEKPDVKTLFTDDNDDLFGTGPLNFSSHSGLLGTKPTSTTSKSKKLHGTCPLFDDSDSDDDLFSSPRGSLGSKKSQSSMNLSQEINPVLRKDLLDDVSVRRQNESMEHDLFKALKNTSKNNDLFADLISDDEGNDDGDLFSTLKSNKSGAKHKISSTEKKDMYDKTTSEIPSLAKSVKNVNEVLQKGKSVETNKQLEPAPVLSVKTESRRDSGDSLSTENVSSPGKLNADRLPKINPAALLPGTQHRIIRNSAKTMKTEQNSFPSRDEISTLQNIVKDRAKIQVKRRLPTRRARQEALRGLAVDDHESVSNKSTAAPEDNTRAGDGSMIMSPSTDEEDVFGVPPLEVSSETKMSSSPTDIFSEPAIISPGQSSIFTGTVHHSEFVSSASNIDSKHSTETVQSTRMLEKDHESVHVSVSSANKKLITSDELMDSVSGVRADFDDRLFENNLKGTDQNSTNISVASISTEDELFYSDSSISKSITPIGGKLLRAENSGNINTTLSNENDKLLLTTKLQNSVPKVSHDLFDDSDLVSGNLFSSNLESKPKPKLPNKKSLFDDENEDDDIFSTSVSASTSKNAETVQKKPGESGTSKSNNFPKRPVKLTSQQAFTDPLMSSGN